jgi:aminopeptidase N
VLAAPDTATDAAYQRVEAVVAHEYFHNWSGNRVTCRDWFQLSLKEGFTVFRDAEFSSDMNSRTVKRIEDVNFLRSVQFAEDAGPMAHPIRPESYIEISNFYTTTVYEKGSEVVRMLHTLLGPEAFRRGSDLYFARHDGAAATTDDFVVAMGEASEVDLGQFRRWYEQAGTPQLSVTAIWQDAALTLRIHQSCPATPGQPHKPPLHIPVAVGLLDSDGRELVTPELQFQSSARSELRPQSQSLLLHLTEPETELVVHGLRSRPEISFLRGFSAPVRVDFPRESSSLAFLAVHDSDGFARWDALQTLLVDEISRLQARPDLNVEIGAEVSGVFAELLDSALATQASAGSAETKFMLAALLTIPDEGYLFEQIPGFDVDGVVAAREALHQHLAQVHQDRWQQLYQAETAVGVYSADALSMAGRSLRNVALSYLAATLRGSALQELLLEHFSGANNLTDRRAALWEMVESDSLDASVVEEVLAGFYQRWRDKALVVDLWFSLQAAGRLCDVQRLRELEAHTAFDQRNPNKLRAVYGAFAQRNHRNFHALDGSGYDFLADCVIRLNSTNPQIAARLLTPLTRWQRYDGVRQGLMCDALQRIAQTQDLSKDVFEVVRKSLAPAS